MIKKTFIPAKGRNKFGDYPQAVSAVHSTAGGGGYTPQGGGTEGFSLQLSKSSMLFDGMMLMITGVTDSTKVIGYKGIHEAPTFIGDITKSEVDNYYDITGVVSGMTVNVVDNGTTGTTLEVTVTSACTQYDGSLLIPCSVYRGSKDMDDTKQTWVDNNDECTSLQLEVTWTISQAGGMSTYVLDLTNENTGINCDSEGHILSGATRPECTAVLYYGEQTISGATFSISYPAIQNVSGVTIDETTGKFTFGSDFTFDGTALEILVTAMYGDNVVGRKVMTVSKTFSGKDGSPAVTYWLVLSAKAVHVNKNITPIGVTPSGVTATAMMQLGGEEPVEATGVTIYYGYNTTAPATPYTGTVEIDISKDTLAFVLKKGNTIVDGIETIPILKDGTNAENLYTLHLSNQVAGINCDSNGNILAGATRPTCTAKLYHGNDPVTNAVYSIGSYSLPTSGVSINSTTGVITFNAGSASQPFNFTGGTALEITVQAKISNVLYGTAIMTISKNYGGANATTYWLNVSATEVKVTNTTPNPSTITATAMKQVGENTPVTATDAVIKWGYNTSTPSTGSTYHATVTNIDVTKDYLCFQLLVNNIQRDLQTVIILHQPKDGEQGRKGAAIRGPVNWYTAMQVSGRRWCNGEFNADYPDDALWIDVIFKDDHYLFCNTSYTEAGADWNTVASKWTQADSQFEFIATKLLLANNAAIDFLTGNEIYLRDSNNNITAGAAGGNGISFWAGSSNPATAPFRVSADGSMVATSGTFAGFIQMPYYPISSIYTKSGGVYTVDNHYSYIVIDQDGSAASSVRLPTPSATYNGFVYHFINVPGKEERDRYAVDILSTNNANVIVKFTDFIGKSVWPGAAAKVHLGAGAYDFLCVKLTASGDYMWLITNATGSATGSKYSDGVYTTLNWTNTVRSTTIDQILVGPHGNVPNILYVEE